MPNVHFYNTVYVTPTNGEKSPILPLGLPVDKQWEKALELVDATKRGHWPVVVQEVESYKECGKANGGSHCGHCNSGDPLKEVSLARCHDGNGSPRSRNVEQKLYTKPTN